MPIDALRKAVRAGEIDTVIVAMTDMQGRLQGKRFHAQFFLDEVAAHGTEACAYLLAVDTEMNTVDGYALTSWVSGYGDFALAPDLATMRAVPAARHRAGACRRPRPRRPGRSGRRPGRCCKPSWTGSASWLDLPGRNRT